MDSKDLVATVKKIGLDEKAARIYLACLEIGEATIKQISDRARLKRTTIYYIMDELIERGILFKTLRKKKAFYLAESPSKVLAKTRETISEFEEDLPLLEARNHVAHARPRVYYLYGTEGFKDIWDKIFSSRKKEFSIITEGVNFLDFVKEKYVLDKIIKKKKELDIRSRQLIVNSPYARKIIAKDGAENRKSKLLPFDCRLHFTEIISEDFVAFISPRFENMILVINNEPFAKTRKNLFDILWNSLPQ